METAQVVLSARPSLRLKVGKNPRKKSTSPPKMCFGGNPGFNMMFIEQKEV